MLPSNLPGQICAKKSRSSLLLWSHPGSITVTFAAGYSIVTSQRTHKMLQHSGTGCRWRNFDRPCYWLIRQSDTWNVMHLLLALSLLSKDVQRKLSCHFHYFKHNHNPTTIRLVSGVDSFCEKLREARPQLSSLGTSSFASAHKSLQHEEYRWSMLAGSFEMGFNCWWYFVECFVFSNVDGISEAYRFGKAGIVIEKCTKDLLNQSMEVGQQRTEQTEKTIFLHRHG